MQLTVYWTTWSSPVDVAVVAAAAAAAAVGRRVGGGGDGPPTQPVVGPLGEQSLLQKT